MAEHETVEKLARAIYEAGIPKGGKFYHAWEDLESQGFYAQHDLAMMQARAAIAAMGDGWQDIASAPKSPDLHNVAEFLAWCPSDGSAGGYRRVVWWEPKQKCWSSDRDIPETFTHWRPLPPSPGEKP